MRFNSTQILLLVFSFMLINTDYSWANFIVQTGTDSEINFTDINGKKQGLWKVFDGTGLYVIEEGVYKDNKKDGVWLIYYADGVKKSEITYVNGEPKGRATFYYENGKVRESGIWQDEHWVGSYKYFYESGQLSYDWNYNSKGKREGEQKYFHKNGAKMYEGSWINGQTSGVLKVYNEDGLLVEEKVYQDGKFAKVNKVDIDNSNVDEDNATPKLKFNGTGNHTVFTKEGKIDIKGYFENGVMVNGEKFNYDESGQLINITIYKNGKKEGVRH